MQSSDTTAMASVTPTPEDVRAALKRVLASRHFRESRQLQSFFSFTVEETLEGRQDGLKEYMLGCQVFGRKPDYDPRHDGIVRVQATALRKRLAQYYAEEGATDSVILELPRGGYVPTFRLASTTAEPVLLPEPPPRAPQRSWRPIAIAFLGGAALMTLLFTLRPDATPKAFQVTAASQTDFPEFWRPLVQPRTDTLIAYGVPLFYSAEGIYFRDVEVNTPANEEHGRIREFARNFNVNPQPTDDTYTGVGEVEATYLLTNFFSTNGVPVKVTNARALGLSDLNRKNLVIVSSLRFQTILSELTLPRTFKFIARRPESIENLAPGPGEERIYSYRSGAGVATSYALVSVWPGLDPARRIVHIGGVHTWSTQAATQFMLDAAEIRKLSRRFEQDKERSPYFQILLRVEGRENHSQKVEYVTHHYLPGNAQTIAATHP